MCECWYHAELSQASAEQLLICDGRDGAFLVRQSESVPGAYAICLMYHQQVHTYRVLPDDNGLLSVQSVQGVDVKRFCGLSNLISAYRRRGNGLVIALLYPVRDDDVHSCSCWMDVTFTAPKRLLKARGASTITHNASLQDGGALSAELDNECLRLDKEIKATWSSLKIVARLFGCMSSTVHDNDQTSAVDNLLHVISEVLHLLSSLEEKVARTFHESCPSSSALGDPRVPTGAASGEKGIRRSEQRVKPSEDKLPGRSAPLNLSIFVGTWNMGGSPPPRSPVSWLCAKKLKGSADDGGSCDHPDLYMIGAQESPQGDREWAEYVRAALTSRTTRPYKVVSSHSVGGIKLLLLVKEEYEDLISHVQTSSVRTRSSNALGVRGAAGVSLKFDGTSLGFITCHLVSGTEKVQKRNQSFGEIVRGLALGDDALRAFQLPLRLTYLFWAGDLNYKLDMPVQDVLQCVYSGQHQLLLPVDQLNQEREKKKVFLGFKEEPISFPPTRRYERGSRTYDLQKTKTSGTRIVAPSWSDRILWTCYPDTDVKCTSYGCTDDMVSSDHAPVFATFEIGLNFSPRRDCSYTLKFLNIESIVKTQSRSRATIQFRSLCLKEGPQSTANSAHSTEGSAFLKLGWSEQDLPEITLVAGDTFTGHLLLCIRPMDGGEAYGECCVSVLPSNNAADHQFQAFLSQRGEETGSLRGRVRATQHPKVNPDRSPVLENLTRKSRPPSSPGEASSSRSSRRSGRRRPASICCDSYSNAEYFLFEGLSSPSTPMLPRPRSAVVSGEGGPWRDGDQD